FCARLESWIRLSETYNSRSFGQPSVSNATFTQDSTSAEFPLLPISKSTCTTLRQSLVTFRQALTRVRPQQI
ncbi:hypothetical protein GE061_003996, partial [Apolygus lucorum]